MPPTDSIAEPVPVTALASRWRAAWPEALACWSRFTRLRPPLLCETSQAAAAAGLTGSFAMIRLHDQAIVVDLPQVAARGLGGFAVEILAHEVGHHVLAPATLTDHLRMISRMRWALPSLERHTPMVANLYTDLLINDRLQRTSGRPMHAIYQRLRQTDTTGAAEGRVWVLYLRIYEILWSLERGALGSRTVPDRIEGDAWLGARLVRSYARDAVRGSGRFAALVLPHLLEDREAAPQFSLLQDTREAGAGALPSGAVEVEGDEQADSIHPAQDPELAGEVESPADASPSERIERHAPGRGQAREPFDYGELLRSAGLRLDDHDAAVHYYRQRARPHLIPFPRRTLPESTDPLPEGLEPWDAGHPLDAVDWLQSVLLSPHVVPGLTTVQRVYGTAEGAEPQRQPVDLDLYIDSSGSMPDPRQRVSNLCLAGAILALSALRAGGRVRAVLWSGKNEFETTPGFVRDETAILRVLTGCFGGGTQFPLHLLRDTYLSPAAPRRPVHVLVISDDGVSTMFDADERGRSGWEIAGAALTRAGAGGTLVLNLPAGWDDSTRSHAWSQSAYAAIRRARDEQGWAVHAVSDWEQLVAFAREFSRRRFALEAGAAHSRGESSLS